jgi:triphosphatase
MFEGETWNAKSSWPSMQRQRCPDQEDRGAAPAGRRQAQARDHVDRYFDTADFTLWQHGFALRVRSDGTRHVQTLKGGGSVVAGLHRRTELEAEVASAAPDPRCSRASCARPCRRWPSSSTACGGRWSRCSSTGPSVPAGCWSWPTACRSNARSTPASCSAATAAVQVRELELEIKEGDPARLYELARQVHEAVPVRIENVSKAERGYALAGAVAPRAVKATPVALKRKASMGEALAAILRNCLEQMQANEPGVLAGEVESLHQMRVGLRRLRAAMAMVKDLVQLPAPLAADVEWLAGELGDARNWDVFIESLLPGLPLPEEHKPALARVEAAAREEAERHRAACAARWQPALHGADAGPGRLGCRQGLEAGGRAADAPPGRTGSEGGQGGAGPGAARRRARAQARPRHRPAASGKPAQGAHRRQEGALCARILRSFKPRQEGSAPPRPAVRHAGRAGLLNDGVVARGLVGQLRERVPQELALLGFIEGVLAERALDALPRAGKRVRSKLRVRVPNSKLSLRGIHLSRPAPGWS